MRDLTSEDRKSILTYTIGGIVLILLLSYYSETLMDKIIIWITLVLGFTGAYYIDKHYRIKRYTIYMVSATYVLTMIMMMLVNRHVFRPIGIALIFVFLINILTMFKYKDIRKHIIIGNIIGLSILVLTISIVGKENILYSKQEYYVSRYIKDNGSDIGPVEKLFAMPDDDSFGEGIYQVVAVSGDYECVYTYHEGVVMPFFERYNPKITDVLGD